MAIEKIPGLGPLIVLTDIDGCRHMFRAHSITLISDHDMHQTETRLVVNGRTLTFNLPLDTILDEVRAAQGEVLGY